MTMLQVGKLDADVNQLARGPRPAVLLGGLNVLRCLGQASIPTVLATWDPDNLALLSRYASGRLLLPNPRHRRMLIDLLCATGQVLTKQFGQRIPLFYGNDDALRLVYEEEQQLERHYLILASERELGLALLDKDLFEGLMLSRGLPVPRTFSWNGEAGGAGPVAGADCRLIVKPKSKAGWHGSRVFRHLMSGRGKGRIYGSAAELLQDEQALQLKDDLIIQEYVPGGDEQLVSYHALADERVQLLAGFSGRKIRTFPRGRGESSFIELIRDEELESFGRHVVETLGIRGPCKIDVKRCAESGRMYILEINARYTLWNYLGAANGLNLPAIAYDYMVYDRVPRSTAYATRYRWLEPYSDYHAFRELSAGGELNLLQWTKSLTSSNLVQDVFALEDPVPFIGNFYRWLAAKARRWLPLGF